MEGGAARGGGGGRTAGAAGRAERVEADDPMRKAGALCFVAAGRIRFVAFLQAAHALPIIVFFVAISTAFPWIRQTPARSPAVRRMPHERAGRKTEPNRALVKLVETIFEF